MRKLMIIGALLLCGMKATAQIQMAEVFTDNMVMQREKPALIWGTAEPNTSVSVKFNGQSVKGKTDAEGRFELRLAPMEANARPQTLTVATKKSKKEITNVLVGEVWLASGQSNMEFNMGRTWNDGGTNKTVEPKQGENIQAQELKEASQPMMRLLFVKKNLKTPTLPTDGWEEINAETLPKMSAVAYFFGKNLIDSLHVPVGMIVSAWGGTTIQGWTPGEKSDRYNHMIRPIAPMAMRGIIWYQGCSNLMEGVVDNYFDMQKKLMEGWRTAWNDSSLPFFFVELAPYDYSNRRNYLHPQDFTTLPRFRQVQYRLAEEVPNSGVVSTIDLCDNTRDIHPTYKWEVGRRLADMALNRTYGQRGVITDGPKMVGVRRGEGNQVVVEFDHPLKTRDGKAPVGFVLCGSNGRDIATEAYVDDRIVVVKPKKNQTASYVTYCWDEKTVSNLCGLTGLPARQFGPTKP